jgi:hypothetical protein
MMLGSLEVCINTLKSRHCVCGRSILNFHAIIQFDCQIYVLLELDQSVTRAKLNQSGSA